MNKKTNNNLIILIVYVLIFSLFLTVGYIIGLHNCSCDDNVQCGGVGDVMQEDMYLYIPIDCIEYHNDSSMLLR